MKYKAIFLDVDGTIVPNYSQDVPSVRVSDAIAKARRKGIHVGLVTGRPLNYLHNILDHLQLEGPSVITNGSQIIDSVTKKTIWQQTLSQKDLKECLQIVDRFAKRVIVNDDGHDKYTSEYNTFEKPLMIYVESLPADEAESLISALTHIPTISAGKVLGMKDHQLDVGVSHVAATKQHGILEAAELLGISTEEIVGIGDGYNDFPLMMAAGFKVAMGNAIEDLKAIADYVAPTVDEDGVAHVIEKFILQD